MIERNRYFLRSFATFLFAISGMTYANQDVEFQHLDRVENVGSEESDIGLVASSERRLSLSRSDSLPGRKAESGDHYLEGYVQALIDAHYYEYNVLVLVKDKVIYLYNLPNNDLIASSIISFVEDMPDVDRVERSEKFPDKELALQEEYVGRSKIRGIWFPQSTLIYQPMIAAPLNPVNSVAYRVGDDIMGNIVVAVSLGGVFPIFRWREVFAAKGDLQFDIEGTAWSDFNMWGNNNLRDEISELVNTDYLVGFPFSYAFDKWSFRLRAYHISSHLGDEFLALRPGYQRKNPSMEALDLFTSYQFSQMFRLYVGPGWVFHSDDTYHIAPFYVEYGAEFRIPGVKSYYHQLYGDPFVAVHFRNWQEMKWSLDTTLVLGYEWSKLQGIGQKIRLFLQYHDGYSQGEFFKERTRYASLVATYGY
ncbi:MAG: DUF1207 domain-containing protein [Simkaniaceae bacterium]|nr:DUF1207 domain-containing protein [Simkaniaceae bacterium]